MRAIPLTFKRAKRLRREMSPPEVLLWDALRGSRLRGHRFRRQHAVGPYILDFYCPAARLAVEIDGAGHGHPDQAAHDEVRDRWLGSRGVQVMRFTSADVFDLDSRADVLARIAAAAANSL